MLAIRPCVTGTQEHRTNAGSSARFDLSGRVDNHPRVLATDAKVAAGLVDQAWLGFPAAAWTLELGYFAQKATVRVVRTEVDTVQKGAVGTKI